MSFHRRPIRDSSDVHVLRIFRVETRREIRGRRRRRRRRDDIYRLDPRNEANR